MLIPEIGDLSMLQKSWHRKSDAVAGGPSLSEGSKLNNLYRSGFSQSKIVHVMKSDGRFREDRLRNELQMQVDDREAQEQWSATQRRFQINWPLALPSNSNSLDQNDRS